jgi:hypothetical protein
MRGRRNRNGNSREDLDCLCTLDDLRLSSRGCKKHVQHRVIATSSPESNTSKPTCCFLYDLTQHLVAPRQELVHNSLRLLVVCHCNCQIHVTSKAGFCSDRDAEPPNHSKAEVESAQRICGLYQFDSKRSRRAAHTLEPLGCGPAAADLPRRRMGLRAARTATRRAAGLSPRHSCRGDADASSGASSQHPRRASRVPDAASPPALRSLSQPWEECSPDLELAGRGCRTRHWASELTGQAIS